MSEIWIQKESFLRDGEDDNFVVQAAGIKVFHFANNWEKGAYDEKRIFDILLCNTYCAQPFKDFLWDGSGHYDRGPERHLLSIRLEPKRTCKIKGHPA
jgi:hypothetical protein